MKYIKHITLVLILSTQCYAQDEPKNIKGKDLMEKMDRSELEIDSEINIETSIPKLDVPLIKFDHNNDIDIKVQKPKTKVKPVAVKKQPVTTTTKTTVDSPKENKVIISKKPVTLSQIRKNDKIVKKEGRTYVYRLKKNNIIQYRFKGVLDFESKSLKVNSSDSYYVTDKSKLVFDTRKMRSQAKIKSKSSEKPNTVKPSVNSVTQTAPSEKSPKTTITVEAEKTRIENKFNKGNKIIRLLTLSDLKRNDTIYLYKHGVQLVIRNNRQSLRIQKFWLSEKLETDNSFVIKKSNSKYKVIKLYAPKK